MKKILLLAAFAGLAMTSCKKDYTCTCKDSDVGITHGDDVIIKGSAKKKDAKNVCDAANTTYSGSGYSCTLTY